MVVGLGGGGACDGWTRICGNATGSGCCCCGDDDDGGTKTATVAAGGEVANFPCAGNTKKKTATAAGAAAGDAGTASGEHWKD